MINRRPRTVGTVTLTDDHARQLWNWTLSRQGLHPRDRLTAATEISHAALGLHAARLPSPFATVIARATRPDAALTLLDQPAGLITLRCMRRTLHTLPVDLAAAAHRATIHYRLRDAARRAHNAGVTEQLIDQLTACLRSLLADGPMPYRQIEAELAAAGTAAVRATVKTAWETGSLTYLNASGCWNAERRLFGLTSQLHPDLDLALDPKTATRLLIRAYVDRYGPVTLADATWWSALSRAAVVDALDDPAVELLEVATPWSPSPAYMPAGRYEQFTAADPDTYSSGLQLLAHEDVALKAYAETRARYLADLAPRNAFNQIGEALPTVLVDGEVHGTWTWNPATRTVVPTLLPGRSSARLNRQTAQAADQHTAALRAGWRSATALKTATDAGQLALAI
ncbi:crosslink repair DNA glycosylase YcaQ family protein [Pseudofrankia sp. DC12]|uniref:DNA glycosylase AlkZ-like family protein n=1 Tax=Pseudofrankia sp. DC12 TaxID=683315 RepID=UPI0005F7A33E|nr:crosslink repair DNA glycosylase YcaQ family protein [Pseudofrankia sp. DC12]